jgi:hypothetical protein
LAASNTPACARVIPKAAAFIGSNKYSSTSLGRHRLRTIAERREAWSASRAAADMRRKILKQMDR